MSSTRRTAPSLDIEIPSDRSDLSTWTPQQVDSALAEIYGRVAAKDAEIRRERRYLAEAEQHLDPKYRWFRESDVASYTRSVAKHQAKIDALQVEVAAITAEARPFNAEFKSRPWTRAWIVTSSEGHVHNTLDCSTCNKVYRKQDGTYSDPTEFGWLPQVSGLDEAEIVDLAGEAACTVCYPSAPAVSLSQPNLLDTAERTAAKAARQAEKDALTASRVAKGITPDGTPLVVRWSYSTTRWARNTDDPATVVNGQVRYEQGCAKTLKTERAAELFVVEALAGKSYDHPTPEAIQQVVEAIAWKRDIDAQDVLDSLVKKVAKKRSS